MSYRRQSRSLTMQLAEAYRLISELSGQVGQLSARVEELERQARKDSSTSSRARHLVGRKGGKSGSSDDWTKPDLLRRAREIGIEGRSTMTKAELIKALRNH